MYADLRNVVFLDDRSRIEARMRTLVGCVRTLSDRFGHLHATSGIEALGEMRAAVSTLLAELEGTPLSPDDLAAVEAMVRAMMVDVERQLLPPLQRMLAVLATLAAESHHAEPTSVDQR